MSQHWKPQVTRGYAACGQCGCEEWRCRHGGTFTADIGLEDT